MDYEGLSDPRIILVDHWSFKLSYRYCRSLILIWKAFKLDPRITGHSLKWLNTQINFLLWPVNDSDYDEKWSLLWIITFKIIPITDHGSGRNGKIICGSRIIFPEKDPLIISFSDKIRKIKTLVWPKIPVDKENLFNTDLQFLCEKCFHSNAFEHQRAPP